MQTEIYSNCLVLFLVDLNSGAINKKSPTNTKKKSRGKKIKLNKRTKKKSNILKTFAVREILFFFLNLFLSPAHKRATV